MSVISTCFFFSSRRRHTRFDCDWSSDVCSSDLVADDASSDGTAAVLASYAKVLPLTIVTHRERRGYARSLEELLRLALQRTDRAKRDCAITLHADFVHSPECMEEMVKRIESGADLVVAEQREERGRAPRALWFARQWTPRLLPEPRSEEHTSELQSQS